MSENQRPTSSLGVGVHFNKTVVVADADRLDNFTELGGKESNYDFPLPAFVTLGVSHARESSRHQEHHAQ